ncbi:MAG: hypothetical protein K2O96_00650, partial [Lachnospiraceae bacterium]|nr:hypothetical protein [Lachnospiraceae bacterium]
NQGMIAVVSSPPEYAKTTFSFMNLFLLKMTFKISIVTILLLAMEIKRKNEKMIIYAKMLHIYSFWRFSWYLYGGYSLII